MSAKEKALSFPHGIARGQNKGHVVTKYESSKRKHKGSEHKKFVRSVIRDTVGYTSYEKRLLEILKGGGNNPTKRAYKFAKKRLGTHTRAKRKVREMEDLLAKTATKKR